jgi:hypothetical protein
VQPWLNQAEHVLSVAWRGSGLHTFTSEWVRRVLVAPWVRACARDGRAARVWTGGRGPHTAEKGRQGKRHSE